MTNYGLTAAAVALLTSTAGLAQDNCGGDIHYSIRYAGDDRFEISAEFEQTRGTFDISWREAAGTQDGPVDFVSALEVRLADGRWVTPSYVGHGTWEAGRTDVTALRYVLTAAHDNAVWDIGKEEIAYRFDDAYYFTGSNAFIADYGWQACGYVMDFDVPGEVKRFLEEIQSGGAPLDLLTDTVKDWLKANNAFDSYRILPRSADGRR